MVNNAPVATLLPAFPEFPLGVTSGTYPAHTLDLTMASSYNPAFITAHGMNVAQAEADFIAGILGGQSYLNIHTVINGGGEIRAQLVPARRWTAGSRVGERRSSRLVATASADRLSKKPLTRN